jgi:hypothetical protein
MFLAIKRYARKRNDFISNEANEIGELMSFNKWTPVPEFLAIFNFFTATAGKGRINYQVNLLTSSYFCQPPSDRTIKTISGDWSCPTIG